jgi:hypothetical protein
VAAAVGRDKIAKASADVVGALKTKIAKPKAAKPAPAAGDKPKPRAARKSKSGS